MGGRIAAIALVLFACAPRLGPAPVPTPPAPDTAIVEPSEPLPDPTELVVSDLVLNNLAWQYAFWLETEWAGCLYGEQRGDTLVVEHFRPAFITEAGPREVSYQCYLDGLIGAVHSHTPVESDAVRRCTFSYVDDASREKQWRNYPVLRIDMLACGPDRYAFLLRGSDTTRLRFMSAVAPVDSTVAR